jgi:putative ATP-dependent endonuclease of the OLD family
MNCITKIKLHNFKRFENFEVELEPDLNLLIGDNESGKSMLKNQLLESRSQKRRRRKKL